MLGMENQALGRKNKTEEKDEESLWLPSQAQRMTHVGWRGRNKRGVWISDTQQMKTRSAPDIWISTGILGDVLIPCVKGG